MRRASFVDMNCSIARTLEIIGEWWTILILRDAFFGVRRFDEFVDRLGISRNVLTDRLDTLVEAGVLDRTPYDEARGRFDYTLTEKGRALWPVLVTLRQWGDEWELGEGSEPVLLEHTTCGRTVTAHLACDHCGEVLHGSTVRSVPGPGHDRAGGLRG
jgi:DNA-binding HxlR family transcriptional regulator